jgi:lipopolysaccharide transport system ATP-binding protein
MTSIALRVNDLSKQYRRGVRRQTGTLREAVANIGKSALHALTLSKRRTDRDGASDHTRSGELFWALKDVSFDVKQGEVVGIIGRNGAGKSTILKILSRITAPTTGWAEINGRVASLLEVGTGFHPELTGRENVFLNGAILGMSRAETHRKFDDIVAFSELDQFIDTAVKFYSSGMYMRLAFAVAAHLDPDILIVDEVLAVGDSKFQKKCLGKMGQIAGAGITVLLVSHNLAVISSLATRSAWLEAGQLKYFGDTKTGLGMYRKLFENDLDLSHEGITNRRSRHIMKARFTGFVAQDAGGKARWVYRQEEDFTFAVRVRRDEPTDGLSCIVAFHHAESNMEVTNLKVVLTERPLHDQRLLAFRLSFSGGQLRPGDYSIRIWLSDRRFETNCDALDENVGLPVLTILPACTDATLNRGFFSIQHELQSVTEHA